MVTPFQRAREVYESEPCARTFEEDLLWHFRLGWVVSTPTLFLMARQVCRDWPRERLQSPWYVHPRGDAVWLWLLAGDMREAWGAAPWPGVSWVGWERGNKPRFWPRKNLFAKVIPVPLPEKWNSTALHGSLASLARVGG